MSLADLSMGLGSLVYALAKADGFLQPREITQIRELLRREPYGDVALCAFTVRDYHHDTAQEAYQFAWRCFDQQRHALTPERLKHVEQLLEAVARLDGRVCQTESELMRQFREDFCVPPTAAKD